MQGVNPWIEVDGGVTPENAYKVGCLPCEACHFLGVGLGGRQDGLARIQ